MQYAFEFRKKPYIILYFFAHLPAHVAIYLFDSQNLVPDHNATEREHFLHIFEI